MACGGDTRKQARGVSGAAGHARAGVESICRNDPRFPAALAGAPGGPCVLHVAGGVERLRRLLGEPAVAIVGTANATDYGMETARGLARGLAASGVTVLGALAEGIAAAAHMGALDVPGPTVTVMPCGVDICYPASRRSLYERLREFGCAVSEVPCGQRARRWSHIARTRILVRMAQLVIVVEAEQKPGALAAARIAQTWGRTVAAVPGRVSSPVSEGPHALLAQGAHLVRDAQDALDALYGVGCKRAPRTEHPMQRELRAVLEQVRAGRDTLGKLTAAGARREETIVALADLELAGALVRGDGGRYLPRG
jgi:DNA processing protein